MYKEKIKEFVNSGDKYKEIEGVKEIGRADRARITRRVESKSLHVEAQIDLNKRRELNQELMDRLDEDTKGKIRAALLELGDGQES